MDFHNIETVYWLLFIVGFLFTVISGILSGFGGHGMASHGMGGHDFGGHGAHGGIGHVDVAHGGAHGAPSAAHGVTPSGSADLYQPQGEVPMSPINFLTISIFITGFGGGGIIGTNLGFPWWITFLMSFVLGYFSAFGIYHFMVWLNRNIGSSEAQVADMVGLTAEIITPIVDDGMGEIAYITRGSRYQAPARSVDGKSINRGRPVKIWRLVGSTCYVKEITPEEAEHVEPDPSS
jgi:membrane protein implicated in regulation of membrane protease activity